MTKLTGYFLRQFLREAMGLYAIILVLLFLVRILTVADVGSVRSEGLGILLYEAILGMTPLATAFLYVCIAIGLARALRALQQSQELHIVHAGRRISQLFGAIALLALGGTVVVLLLSHVVAPWTGAREREIRAQVAAELVGTKLVPNRFAELAPNVIVTVGGREGDGSITSFFADDRRTPEVRRTYIADSAVISQDDEGYVLRLSNGTIQYRNTLGEMSEVSFARYDISLDRLTGDTDTQSPRVDNSSFALIANAIATGSWPPAIIKTLTERTAEGLRVIALCLFVTALAGFPSGRRRPPLIPVEVTVLLAAFVERALSTFLPNGPLTALSGSVLLLAIGSVWLVLRLRLLSLATYHPRPA